MRLVLDTAGVLVALRTESFFRERAERANLPEALAILARAGAGNPPVEGDELPGEGAEP